MGKHPTYTMADVVRMAQVTVRTVCRDITFRRLRLRPPPFDGRLRPGTEILRVLRATARATTQTAERADVVRSVFVAPKDLSGNGESAEGQFSGRFNRAVFRIGQPQSAMLCTLMAVEMPLSSERIPVEEAVLMQKFAPLSVDHPLVNDATGTNCPGCNQRFRAMDVITRVAIGPGDNEEARRLCREGSFYEAVGIPVHWACATGEV